MIPSELREYMARRPTIQDIAEEAGVSVATVDRVLNGRLKVREETAQAFLALEFRRKEARKAASSRENKPLGPYSAVSVAPSSAPVPVATPAPATRADLLTLEDRVRRLETILRNHCIGAEDEWLREG